MASTCFRKIVLDGEEIIIPCLEAWAQILDTGIWDGVAVHSFSQSKLSEGDNAAQFLLTFVREHEGLFELGLQDLRPALKSYTPTPIFIAHEPPLRAQIEHVSCIACGTKHRIANPADAGLFLGVRNKFVVLKEASELANAVCRVCAASLPRPAVWAEVLPTADIDGLETAEPS